MRLTIVPIMRSKAQRKWLLPLLLLFIACPVLAQQKGLDFYLTAGQERSPLLKDYGYQLRALDLDSAKVYATFGPQVSGTGQILYAPYDKHWGYDVNVTNGGLYSAVVGARLPLFNKNQKQAQLSGIAVQHNSVRTGAAVTTLDLRRSIAGQYIAVYADQRALEFTESQVRLLTEQEQVLKHLAERGLYQQTDLLALQVSLQAQRIAARQAQALFRNDLYALNQLCGVQDTTTIRLLPPELVPSTTFNADASPVMQQFRLDSVSNTIADRTIDLAYRPRLNITGDLGLNAITPTDIPNRFGGSAGMNLNVPIYDGRQRRLEHDRVALREQTRQAYQTFYLDQLAQRHGQFQEALRRADTLLSELQQQSTEEERLIALYRLELERGLVRLTDLFLVLNNHAATVSALIQSDADRARIINELIHLK
ncbi:MAG: TolC family protein [Flavobacteriales bacterium]|nr:TolC family protein [Flavobacteriales bacterium]